MKNPILSVLAAILVGVFTPSAHAFKHPGIPVSLDELDTIKANLDKEPWKSGYAGLLNDGRGKLNYVMAGPFVQISRKGAYDQNLQAWRSDMTAVYSLARMWYFTGNPDYAKKARDILIAWATTHISFSGNEAGLDLGDYAAAYGGGASILRGTWPGWTPEDTKVVQNYFANVFWPSSAGWDTQGPANKGALYLACGMAVAVFCDDTDKFNHVLNMVRTFHGTGLMNTLSTGQMGETGRDAGHSYGTINAMAFIAECAWKQGVDLYSEMDNRLLACGEYYARNTLAYDNPYVPFGTIDWLWLNNSPGPYVANRYGFYLLQNAYKNRKNLPTPWIDRKLEEQPLDGVNFMVAKTVDSTTATVSPASFPTASLASSGLTLTTLGNQTAGRSVAYANGVWTLTGLGNGVWSETADDCQFAYTQMTGDCAMIAKVTSNQYPGGQARAGLMIRDSLVAPVTQRSWIGVSSAPTLLMESNMRGWTTNWGGGGYDDRSHQWPPGLPYWIKIERRSKQITTFASPDGTSWMPLNCTYYGNLPATLYIGLFISSGGTTPNTATFTNVAFTGGTGGLVTVPAAPAGILASGSQSVVTLRWLQSFGATTYDVLRSATPGGGYAAIATGLSTDKSSYVDANVVPGTTYYYVVRAKNSVGTSPNSSEFAASLLSVPMNNIAFGGTTTASFNGGSATEGAAKAFDRNPGTKWFCWNSPAGWLQYDFGAGNAQIVKRYTVGVADVMARNPKDWSLLGSQDGSLWTTLDTRTSQTFRVVFSNNSYDIPNTTAYRYYRLDIFANNGDTSVAVGELGLFSDVGRTVPDGTYRLVNRTSNKVLDVASAADGAAVVQRAFTGASSQQWTFAWLGNGSYRVTCAATGKVLDNTGVANPGANLIALPWTSAARQSWNVLPAGDGALRLVSVDSGLSAAIAGASSADGANLVQQTYTGSGGQRWMLGVAALPQPVPQPPTNLAITTLSTGQASLTWTANPLAISYNIKRGTVSGGPYATVAKNANGTTFTDTGLDSNVTYYYVLSAVNGNGEGADSAQTAYTTPVAPPDAPTGVTVTLGTNRAILKWTGSGGASNYVIGRSTTPGGPYTTIATGVTGLTYTDTGLVNGVTYHYSVAAVNSHGTSPGSTEVNATPNDLYLRLKFDETGGALASDSSGRGNHATLLNIPPFAMGMFGNAINFPTTAGQYGRLPSGIVSDLTDFTIATWIKANTFAIWQRIFDLGTGTTNYMYLAIQYNNASPNANLRYGIRASASSAEQAVNGTDISFPAGAWTHVAVTRSGATVSIYVNGVLSGSGTVPLNPSDLGATTANYIGKSQFNDPLLNAALDEFRIYDRALSAAELVAMAHPPAGAPRQLAAMPGDTRTTLTWSPDATTSYVVKRAASLEGPYVAIAAGLTDTAYTDTGLTNGATYYYVVSGANADGPGPDSAPVAVTPSNLALFLKFDETGGTVAYDSSGRLNHAMLNNAPGFTSGRLGNALNLTSASVQYATLPAGLVANCTDFTFSTWVKINSFVSWQRIFDFGTGGNNYMYLTTQYTTNPADAARLRFAIRTSSVAEQLVNGAGVALVAGAWTHVAVTRSGATLSIYVNGVLAGSGTVTISPSDLGPTTQNYLGKSQANNYLDGSLDEVRLYSRALSAPEVALHAAPLAAPQNLVANPGQLSLRVGWNAVPKAEGYTLKYSATRGGPYATLAAGLTSTSQVQSGLPYGTTYYYVVSAYNSVYQSPDSAEASASAGSEAIDPLEISTPALFITPSSNNNNPGVASIVTGASTLGHTYQLQTSTDLATWQNVGETAYGTGDPLVFLTDYYAGETRRFYRVIVTR